LQNHPDRKYLHHSQKIPHSLRRPPSLWILVPSNHWSAFCHESIVCILCKWNHTLCILLYLAFALCISLQDLLVLLCALIVPSQIVFYFMNVPHFCLFSQLLMNIWVVYRFELLA
jgi:hypothetical protein